MKALITGGSQGLGAALVRQLAAQHVEICVLDREAPPSAPGVSYLNADLAHPDALDASVARLERRGPFDLVIMCAGISAVGSFEKDTLGESFKVVTVNAIAPVILTQRLFAHNLLAPRGRIVFVSSLSHFVGYPGASAYAASKDALVGFARSIRRPSRKNRQVTVQVAAPGPMKTAHAERHAPPGSSEKGRMEPEVAARAILRSSRQFWIVPGASAKAFSLFGRLFPQTATRMMRRIIYERLT